MGQGQGHTLEGTSMSSVPALPPPRPRHFPLEKQGHLGVHLHYSLNKVTRVSVLDL